MTTDRKPSLYQQFVRIRLFADENLKQNHTCKCEYDHNFTNNFKICSLDLTVDVAVNTNGKYDVPINQELPLQKYLMLVQNGDAELNQYCEED